MSAHMEFHRTDSMLGEELEVLESIYIHELTVERDRDSGRPDSIRLDLHPSTGDDLEKQYVCMTLIISPTLQYPDEPPVIEIKNPRGISEEAIQRVTMAMRQLAEERQGGPMLYELTEIAKECLTESNIPHAPCAICLEEFTEGDSFMKTDCYHYFHHYCLARYIHYVLNKLEEQDDTKPPGVGNEEQEEEGVVCPICRLSINYDLDLLEQAKEPVAKEQKYTVTKESKQHLSKMAEVFARQKANGGIIDLEAEKNKYLVPKDLLISVNTPVVSSASENGSEHNNSKRNNPDRQHERKFRHERPSSRNFDHRRNDRFHSRRTDRPQSRNCDERYSRKNDTTKPQDNDEPQSRNTDNSQSRKQYESQTFSRYYKNSQSRNNDYPKSRNNDPPSLRNISPHSRNENPQSRRSDHSHLQKNENQHSRKNYHTHSRRNDSPQSRKTYYSQSRQTDNPQSRSKDTICLTSHDNPQPSDDNPQPSNGNPQPSNDNPQPSNDNPQPRNGNPQPRNGNPQPRNDNPQPRNDNPKQRNYTPKPRNDNPKPRSDNPQPRNDNPCVIKDSHQSRRNDNPQSKRTDYPKSRRDYYYSNRNDNPQVRAGDNYRHSARRNNSSQKRDVSDQSSHNKHNFHEKEESENVNEADSQGFKTDSLPGDKVQSHSNELSDEKTDDRLSATGTSGHGAVNNHGKSSNGDRNKTERLDSDGEKNGVNDTEEVTSVDVLYNQRDKNLNIPNRTSQDQTESGQNKSRGIYKPRFTSRFTNRSKPEHGPGRGNPSSSSRDTNGEHNREQAYSADKYVSRSKDYHAQNNRRRRGPMNSDSNHSDYQDNRRDQGYHADRIVSRGRGRRYPSTSQAGHNRTHQSNRQSSNQLSSLNEIGENMKEDANKPGCRENLSKESKGSEIVKSQPSQPPPGFKPQQREQGDTPHPKPPPGFENAS